MYDAWQVKIGAGVSEQTINKGSDAEAVTSGEEVGAVGDLTSKNAMTNLGKVHDDQQMMIMQNAIIAAGQMTYMWDIANDTIVWGGALDSLFVDANADKFMTGRGYTSLMDIDNEVSRFDTVMNSAEKDLGQGVAFQIEYMLRPKGRANSESAWVEDCGRWFAGSNGEPVRVVGVIRRIDARYDRDQKLRYLSLCDQLTGMMNRSRLQQVLSTVIADTIQQGTTGAFLIASVNNLPVINDAYGYDLADDVIAAIAERLQSVVRANDYIGRMSGGKFGFILNDCTEDEVTVAAERFLSAAREQVINTERGPVWAILSIGGVVFPADAGSCKEAISLAEEALAEAKRLPSDSFVRYVPSRERMSLRTLNARCASEIISSLREERFRLAFQPIVNADDHQPKMYEALLRMHCDDGDTVAAHHLIPVAEKLGLVRMIDYNILDAALRHLKQHPTAYISVNVSGVTATDVRWFTKITDRLLKMPEQAKRITVEITETIALHDIDETRKFISQLRKAGCKIAIDDFGAGYTSFKNLQVLDVDMVKIDGSFCQGLSENKDNQYFVRSLVDLAKKFNLVVVAEWVENYEDANLLRNWGVDFLQGNLFGAATICDPWDEDAQSQDGVATGGELPISERVIIDDSEMQQPNAELANGDEQVIPNVEVALGEPADMVAVADEGYVEPDFEQVSAPELDMQQQPVLDSPSDVDVSDSVAHADTQAVGLEDGVIEPEQNDDNLFDEEFDFAHLRAALAELGPEPDVDIASTATAGAATASTAPTDTAPTDTATADPEPDEMTSATRS